MPAPIWSDKLLVGLAKLRIISDPWGFPDVVRLSPVRFGHLAAAHGTF